MTDVTFNPESQAQGSSDPLKAQADTAREKLGEAKHAVADEARSFAQSAKQKVVEQADARKDQVTSAMGDFAAAMRKAGDELGERDQTFAAKLLGQAVDGLEEFSSALTDKAPEDMIHAVRDFGRSNPTAFIAGSVLAGFALGRFARSSSEHQHGTSAAGGESSGLSGDGAPSLQDATAYVGGEAASFDSEEGVPTGGSSSQSGATVSTQEADYGEAAGDAELSDLTQPGLAGSTDGAMFAPGDARADEAAGLGSGEGAEDGSVDPIEDPTADNQPTRGL